MYTTILVAFVIAGLVMLLWLRIISAIDKALLSWPFTPIEKLVGNDYNRNVQFGVGVFLWLLLSPLLAWVYYILVEKSIITYYDAGSVWLLVWLMFTIVQLVTLPLTKCGIAGRLLNKFVWLESLTSWLVFGLVFYTLIK